MEILLNYIHHPISFLLAVDASKAVVHGDLRDRGTVQGQEVTSGTGSEPDHVQTVPQLEKNINFLIFLIK